MNKHGISANITLRRYTVIVMSILGTLVILVRFYGDDPVKYYRNYAMVEDIHAISI